MVGEKSLKELEKEQAQHINSITQLQQKKKELLLKLEKDKKEKEQLKK